MYKFVPNLIALIILTVAGVTLVSTRVDLNSLKQEHAKLINNFHTINDEYKSFKTKTNEKIEQLVAKNDSQHDLIAKLQNEVDVRKVLTVTVTAYTPTPEECDDDPMITAFMTKVRPGIIAVSRDLFEEGWVKGETVYIKGFGVFTIEDLMNKRFTRSIDILVFSKQKAKQIGRVESTAALLRSSKNT